MNKSITLTPRIWAEMLGLGLVWGAIFFFTEIAIREVPPLTTVAIRLGIGAITLWIVVLRLGLSVPRFGRPWGAFAVMGFLNNLVPFTLITWAQTSVTSGIASILNASTAIFGVLIAALLLSDERMTKPKSIGVFVAFVGVIITVGPSALQNFDLTSLAQMAILGAAVSYSLAGVWAKKTMFTFPPMVAAAGMVTCSALMLWPIALWSDGVPRFAYSLSVWAALAYMGMFATALAYLLYYRVLAGAGSANLMLVTLLLPPIAIALGAVFLNETLTINALIGFLIIAVGLLIIDGRLWNWLTKNPR